MGNWEVFSIKLKLIANHQLLTFKRSDVKQVAGYCSMKIRFHQEPTRGRQNKCLVCGCLYNLKTARASVYSNQGIEYGDICPDCLALGAQGIKSRLQSNIQRLREFADELEALSCEQVHLPELEAEFSVYRNRMSP